LYGCRREAFGKQGRWGGRGGEGRGMDWEREREREESVVALCEELEKEF